MAKSLNSVDLIGRAGRAGSLRTTATGEPLLTFSLATDRRGGEERTTGPVWHRVVCFRTLAEASAPLVTTGALVYVHGQLSYRSWTGADGEARFGVDVVADQVIVLARPRPTPERASAGD